MDVVIMVIIIIAESGRNEPASKHQIQPECVERED